MNRLKEVDPTTLRRKRRKEILKEIDNRIKHFNAQKHRHMTLLLRYQLTIEEVQMGLKGEHAIAEVNNLGKKLSEVNSNLVSLAQQKARMLAVRDANKHSAPIPDGLLPHGSNTGPFNSRT